MRAELAKHLQIDTFSNTQGERNLCQKTPGARQSWKHLRTALSYQSYCKMKTTITIGT